MKIQWQFLKTKIRHIFNQGHLLLTEKRFIKKLLGLVGTEAKPLPSRKILFIYLFTIFLCQD